MALEIEDGSLIDGAVSYAGASDVRAYAAARAITVPDAGEEGDAEIESACILAMDFLEGLRAEYQGVKVAPATQALQFPRIGVKVDSFEIAKTTIPAILIAAQCQLAIESLAGTDLLPTGDGREVIREKVDVIETEYAPGNGGSPQPVFAKVRKMLAPLLKSGFGGLRSIRS